jgi:hypothetical protein
MADGLDSVLKTGEPSVRFNVPGRKPRISAAIVQNFYLYPLQEEKRRK